MNRGLDPDPAAPRLGRAVRSALAGLLLVVAVTAAVVGAVRFSGPPIYDGDGWFNIRYAQVLREEGPSRHYPIWQETFLRDHFADKEFLYHVLLIPFTFGDLLSGARIAAIFFACLAMATFYLVARRLLVPAPLLWTLALLACSSDFLFRLTFTRSLVLALSVALAGVYAVLRRAGLLAFVLAAVYANTHVSFHFLPCAALLSDLERGRSPGEGARSRFRMTAATLSGAAAGLLVNPFVPHNARLWFDLNFRVLWAAWAGGAELRPVTEVGPLLSSDLLIGNAGVFLALLLGLYVLLRSPRASPDARILLVMSAGFLALTMMSQRFVEMWAPLTLLFAAVAARDARRGPEHGEGVAAALPLREEAPRSRRARLAVVAAVLVVAAIGGLLALNVKADLAEVRKEEDAQFAGASAWMAENVPAGETIFHLWMDDYAEIYFFNPRLRTLVGWDSTLMLVTDPARYRLWTDVALGRVADAFPPIFETFRCRFVLASDKDERFLRIARRDPRFRIGYEDRAATVFRLEDDPSLLSGWRLVGWYPDPARKLLDVPFPGEPGALAASVAGAPRAQGPASSGLDYGQRSPFVDLDRALGVPPLVPDACAVAETTLASAAPASATLAVTTDDEVRVYLNGRALLEASPYRNPPAGSPGGPAFSLDQLGQASSHVPERIARADLRAGDNIVLVKTCRVGADFGFFLRAFLDDGTPVRPAPRAH